MSAETQEGRSAFGLTFLAIVVVYLVGIGAIVVAAATLGGNGGSSTGSSSTVVEVSLSEFKIDGTLTAPAGKVTLKATNKGTVEHNLAFVSTGQVTKNIAPGASESLDLGELKAGSYDIQCNIPGHADSGMKAKLVVARPHRAPRRRARR